MISQRNSRPESRSNRHASIKSREPFFFNQASNGKNAWDRRLKVRACKIRYVDSIVNALDFRRASRETFAQIICGVVRFGNHRARGIDQPIESDCKRARNENVIRVRGETERDIEEFFDPIRRPRRHPGKVRMQMSTDRQTHADVSGLVKA